MGHVSQIDAYIAANRYRWPIITLDFEASGLGEGTYPIEAGIAIWEGPGEPIRSWSSLIRETDEWISKGFWNPDSEQIHNIPRAELASGLSPREVLSTLNRVARVGAAVYCDGGAHDLYWLRQLEAAAGIMATFVPCNIWILYQALGMHGLTKAEDWRHGRNVAHRARPDAEDHLRSLAVSMGLPEPTVNQATRLAD